MSFNYKSNYIVIPALVLLVGLLGRLLTRGGYAWYRTLQLPAFVPPWYIFVIAWNIIYLCTAFSALIAWNTLHRNWQFWLIIGLFILNAFLNVLWSFLFFYQHQIRAALCDAVALEITVLALIALLWRQSSTAAMLLLPYAVWVGFAIYMNWQIMLLNP